MENLFVSYKLAKLAKDKGFDEKCFSFYSTKDLEKKLYFDIEENEIFFENQNDKYEMRYSAPTHQQVLNWLREKHNIHIEITCGHDETRIWYNWNIYKVEFGYNYEPIAYCDEGDFSYYNTVNTALKEAFKLI